MQKDEQFLKFILIITLLDVASSISISHQSLTRSVGDTFLVLCKDETGLSVTWKGPNGMLSSRTRPSVNIGSYGTAIFFNKTRNEDAGNYTCMLPSSPQTRKVFSLFVEEPFKFQDTPTYYTTVEGKNITLQCHTNLKDVDISWLLRSEEPSDAKTHQILQQGLFIANVTRQDAYAYICQAVHARSGSIIVQNITLDVRYGPSLPNEVLAKEEVYVFLDETLNLTCEVEANPPPKFQWIGQNIGKVLTVSEHISVLQLNVSEHTTGTFQCIASNEEGYVEKYFDVQLWKRPDKPTNIELMEAKADSLKLKVKVPDIPHEVKDPVMDPLWIVVEYKSKSENEWRHKEFNITDVVILTNLSKNTNYEIEAATRNVAGLSEYYSNQEISFETSSSIRVHTKFSIAIYFAFILTFLFWTT